MTDAHELLEIAAEFVSARDGNELARGMGGTPRDLDEIAARFDEKLRAYVTGA